jgi:hypothetical protein
MSSRKIKINPLNLATTHKLVVMACLFMSAAVISQSAFAQTTGNLSQQRQALQSLQSQLNKLTETMEETKATLSARSNEIREWKNRQAESSNPFVHYRLQNMLQEAQHLASQLNEMETHKRELLDSHQQLTAQLWQELENRIETVAQQLNQKPLTTEQKRTLSSELGQLLRDRLSLEQPGTEKITTTQLLNYNGDLLPSPSDSPEDLLTKAALLGDIRDRVENNLNAVRSRLTQIQRQKLIFEEARHLMDEESFFAEMSFAKNDSILSNNTSNHSNNESGAPSAKNGAAGSLVNGNSEVKPPSVAASVVGSESLANSSTGPAATAGAIPSPNNNPSQFIAAPSNGPNNIATNSLPTMGPIVGPVLGSTNLNAQGLTNGVNSKLDGIKLEASPKFEVASSPLQPAAGSNTEKPTNNLSENPTNSRRMQLDSLMGKRSNERGSLGDRLGNLQRLEIQLNQQMIKVNSDLQLIQSMTRIIESKKP